MITSCLTELSATVRQDVVVYTRMSGEEGTEPVTVKAVVKIGEATKQKAVCAGENVTFSLEVTGTDRCSAAWRKVGVADSLQKDGKPLELQNLIPADGGQYYCELIDSTDGSYPRLYSDTLTLTVHSYEVGIQPAAKAEFCVGDTVVLQATHTALRAGADTLFRWTVPLAVGSVVGDVDAASVKFVIQAGGEVRLESSGFGCPAPAQTLEVKVHPFRVGIDVAGLPRDVCRGDSLTLQAVGDAATVYSWKGAGISGATDQAQARVKFADNGVFAVTASDGVCQSTDTVRFRIQRFAVHIQTPSDDRGICLGSPLKLSAAWEGDGNLGVPAYRWTAAGLQSAAEAKNADIIVEEHAGYRLEAALGACKARDSVTYIVHQLKAGILPPLQLDICNGDTVRLEAAFGMPLMAGDTLFSWKAEKIIGPADQNKMKAVLDKEGKVQLTVRDRYCVDSAKVVFDIQQFNVKIQTALPGRRVCSGDVVTLTASGTIPALYSWKGKGIQSEGDQNTVTVKFNDNGIFVLNTDDYNLKCHDTDTIRYVVEQFSAKIVPPEGALTACLGDVIHLTAEVQASETGKVNYRWEGEGMQGVTDQSAVDIKATLKGKYKLYTSLSQCKDVDSLTYTVRSFEAAIVNPVSQKVCYGDTVVVRATHRSVTGDTTYLWTAGEIIGRNDLDSVKVVMKGDGKVSLISRAYGCSATDAYTFTVVRYGVKIQTAQTDPEVCFGSEVTLLASNASTAPLGSVWTWKGDGVQTTVGSSTKLKFNENGKFYLEYTDGQCRERDTIEFTIRKYEVKIQPLAGGLSRCWLDTLTLGASNRNNRPQGGVYAWKGKGTSGDLTAGTVKVRLDDNGQFTLRAFDGKCYSYDTLTFNIHKYEVGIRQPEQGLEVCRGTEVVLSATNAGEQLPAGATYSWSGEGLTGESSAAQVKFVVGEKAEYALKAYDGTCFTYDTLRYRVQTYLAGIQPPLAMAVCYGDEVTLQATDATGDSYAWTGKGISGPANQASVKVVLTENGSFGFRSTKGVCATQDQIDFTIKKYSLSVPASQVLPAPQKVTLRAAKETNAVLDWYVNNTHVYGPSASEMAELDIRTNSQVKVVMTMNADKCTTTAFCNVRVGERDSRKYQGGVADGFTVSRPSLRLRRKDTTACVNTMVIARLQTIQYDSYNFEWWQVGNEAGDPVCTTPDLLIARCQLAHTGKYYCRVKDAEGSGYLYSDTLTLTVENGPVARIEALTEGTDRCYGEEVRLKAASVAANYSYEWTGADIAGGALSQELTLRAVRGGLYTLTVSDGNCRSTDSVRLKVLPALEVDIPDQINLTHKQSVALTAWTNVTQGEVTWKWGSETRTGRGPVTFDVQGQGIVYAVLTLGRCAVQDSGRIYIKEETTFAGGDNDGFDESVAALRVADRNLVACTGERVVMDVSGLMASNCKYEWYLVGNVDQKAADGRTYVINACNLLQAGRYYCQATSGDREWRSDTLTLTVNEGPVAQIQEDPAGFVACFGDRVQIAAHPVGGNYEWSGEGIIAGRYESTMTLKAAQSGWYILKVSQGSCSTTDTVYLKVTRPEVDIPDLMYLAERGNIEVKAVRPDPESVVKWYIEGSQYTASKDAVSLPVNGTGRITIRAEVLEEGCAASDTMLVFVKETATFTTGASFDDGFALSQPRLRVLEKVLRPCPTEDVVMKLRADMTGYYGYTWYKVAAPADVEVGKGMSWQIQKITSAGNGQYYCTALKADAAGTFYSDTVELEVRAGVIAAIQVKNDDKDLCYGEDLIFTAQPSGSQYTYRWNGPGVATTATGASLEMKAGESGKYTLTVSDGACESWDTVTVHVTRLRVDIAATRQLNAPQEAEFQAFTPESRVMWYVGGSLQKTGMPVDVLNIKESCQVKAQVEAQGCVESAVCEVFVKKPTVLYASEIDDGFAESKPLLQVEQSNIVVCQGHEAVIGIRKAGYENYRYEWYKDLEAAPVFIGREYVIPECKVADAGTYYCKVKKPDDDSGEVYWKSPNVTLAVTAGPLAVIEPLPGAVCYGTDTELDASGTGFSQSGKDFDYLWSGPGAEGWTGSKVTIRPLTDAVYVVQVSDAETGCTDTAAVHVKVNHLAVEIPPVLVLAKPQTYRFEPWNPAGATLEWYVDEVVQSGDWLELKQNCTVKVKATLGNCTEYSTCTVLVRKEELYVTTLANGDDDGFAVTLNRPSVKITPKDLEICTANTLKLGLQVAGEGLYKYRWYRTDRDGVVLSEEKEYALRDANANAQGSYYCIVENLMVEPADPFRFLVSDTAQVTYKAGPKAVIGSPLEGSDICNGVPVTLDASASEIGSPGGKYTYEWFGVGADGLTGQQITITPKGEVYVVKVSDGYCSSTDTVRLRMNSPQILLPEQMHLGTAQTIVLKPEKLAGTRINWYVDGALRLANNDVGTLVIDRSCIVTAEVVKNVTDGTCSGYDTTRVLVKTPSTFTTGEGFDDGFAYSLPRIQVKQLQGETEFCRGTEMFRTLTKPMSEKLLKYEWRKVGAIQVVCEGMNLVIPKCQLSDSGRYYCMVTDLAATGVEQKIYYSDTARLTVLHGPVAKISAPAEGQMVCYQAPIDLDASETEIGKYPYTDVYEYLWRGENIKAPTLYHTQANPENSGRYILQVTNGTCTTYDTVSVIVKAPDVHIQRSLFIDRNVTHRFVVENKEKNTVNWYLGNTLKVSGKDSADIYLSGDNKVVVEMVSAGCRKTDTCLVFQKADATFLVGAGEEANDDGFYVSGTSFYINKVVSTELVCNGATSVFTIEVVGNDFYRYAWKKKGNPAVLSTEKTFRIEKTNLSHAGIYYCEVTDVSNNNTRISNEVSLEVIELPVARIVADKQEVCEGTSLSMRADASVLQAGRAYTYLWTGTGIADGRNAAVTLSPRNSGRYILTISDANCFTKDTMDIRVVKQSLKVPKVYMIKAGEDISIKAEVSDGSKVNWRVNNIVYPNVNPLVLNGLKESVTYTAESTGACAEKITGNVFVRSNSGYAGGEDDGFTMPNGMPQIIGHSPEIVGCGLDTVSLFVEVLKKDEVQGYIWQKYDENKRDFAEWTPGLPEGHVTGLGTERIHFSVITAEDEGRYRCRIKSSMGFVNGPATNLVKGTVPVIGGKMNDIQKCEGRDIQFMLTATVPNGKDPQYRWYYSEVAANFRQLLPETELDHPYYGVRAITKSNQGYYVAEAYNLCGSTYDTAYLEVWQKPTIVKQSRDTAVCLETPVRLWVEAKGGGTYGYSLYQIEKDKNGKFVRDIRRVYRGLEPWYDLLVPSDIDQGDYLWMVWNECDSTRHTQSFHLDVEHAPSVHYSYLDTTICIGAASVKLDARANITLPGATTRYRWTKNGASITQTNAIHVINPLAHADTGVYKCYAYNACPAGLMKEFRLHKKEAPVIQADIALAKESYCEGEPVEMNVRYASDAGDVTQQWYFNSQPIKPGDDRIAGMNSNTLLIDSVINKDNGRYYVILRNLCGDRQSNSVNLTVDMPARYAEGGSLAGKDQYLCIGDNAAITVTATGKEEIKYTWSKDGNPIAGARTSRLQLSGVTRESAGEYCCDIQNICNKMAAHTCDSVFIITPRAFKLAGAGKYCGYEAGREVTLAGFEVNATYQLYRYNADAGAAIVATVKGSEVPSGGVLSFGLLPAGRYYAMASTVQGTKICTAQMEGEIEIVRDITPAQYEFVVSDPICTGETNGSLTLKGSENDRTIAYTLQRYSDPDSWNDYGRALPGTGGQLTWSNLAAGIYRVQAVSTQSGCTLQIGQNDTLAERPYPQVFKLTAQRGDTTNCQFMEADVALELGGAEKDCRYTLLMNGASTDRTLSGDKMVWDKVTGTSTGVAYSVRATTKYGCSRDMGLVTVVEKTAPVAMLVKGGGYYCSGDTQDMEITIEGQTQTGVRYDIYRKDGVQVLTDTAFYGCGRPIVFELPSQAGVYYVKGVDTLDGCVAKMQNEFSIREDSLKIMPIAPQTIPSGTSALLYADIRNAVNKPTILWEPVKLFPAGGNTVQGPQTVRLSQGERFVVTADDGYCRAEAYAEVRLEGANLYTQIKLQNCLTDSDTLRLCEGEKVNLCSWTDGGETPYTYKWLDKNVSPVRGIGTDGQLAGYAKEASGYIYLEVTTSVGQFAKDSIWIEYEPKPKQNLVIEHQGLNCALIGEVVDFVVQHSENEVVYSLEYSPDSRRYQPVGQTLAGDGSSLTFGVNYAPETAGYYRLQAEKSYPGGNVCSTTLTLGELRQRPQRFAAEVIGKTDYCADTRRDSIRMQTTETGVTYRLVNTSSRKVVDAVEGKGEPILFSGYFGSGRYRVVGQLGVCSDSMDNVIRINAVQRPLIGDVSGLGVYCLNTTDVRENLVILNPVRGVEYALYRDSVTVREKVGDSKFGSGTAGEKITFNAPEKAGNYFVVSGWQQGMRCTDTVKGLSLVSPPKAVKLKEESGMYCYADGNLSTVVKIYETDPLVDYQLKDLEGKVVATFGARDKDTLSCSVTLKGGKYYIWSTATQCSDILGMYTVEEHKQLADLKLIRPITECEGYNLPMGVQAAERDIVYELYELVGPGIGDLLDQKTGEGKNLVISTQSKAGTYFIRAVDPAGCELQLSETYTISPLPEHFNMTASATEYCAGDAGVVLGLDGTQANVNYLLQKWNAAAGEYVNASASAIIYGTGATDADGKPQGQVFSGKFRAGKYRVVSEGCHQQVMDGGLEIIEIPQPLDVRVSMHGMACVDSTVSIVLTGTEPGIRYALLHNNVYTGLDTLIGMGRDTLWTFTKAKAGIYSVQAIRKGCAYSLSRTVKIGVPTKLVALTGLDPLCANETGTLKLGGAALTSDYKLWGKRQDTIFTGKVSGADVIFQGVVPGDTYVVIAQNEMCESRSPEYVYTAKELPVVREDNFVITDCSGSGKGDILLHGLNNTYLYTLVGPDCNVKLMNTNKDSLLVGMVAGEYCLTVQNLTTKCVIDPICKDVRRALPQDAVVKPLEYCDGEPGVQVRLSGSTYNVRYSMLNLDHSLVETINYPSKAFSNNYTEGKYVFRKENLGLNGGCVSYDTVTVQKVAIPDVNLVVTAGTGGALCEKGNNLLTIQTSERNVNYVLRLDGKTEVDTLAGTGGALVFEGWKKAGTYEIIARSAGRCQAVFPKNWKVNPVPVAVNAPGVQYCYDPSVPDTRGAAVIVKNMDPSAKYYFRKETKLDSITGLNAGSFKPALAGDYVITGIYPATGCWDTVACVNIKSVPLPDVFMVSNRMGGNCDTRAQIRLSGSEAENVDYYLYMNDYFLVTGPVAGNGGPLDFGEVNASGSYRIYAKHRNTECGVWMNGAVVIASAAPKPLVEVRGVYCVGETAGNAKIALLNPVKGWTYFVSLDLLESKRVKITTQTAVVWDSLGGKGLIAGEYILNGINECGDLKPLATVSVKANPSAEAYKVLCGDKRICQRDTQVLELENSELGVSYMLKQMNGSDIVDLLPQPVKGTGRPVYLGEYAAKNADVTVSYYVEATVDSSQCRRVIDTVSLSVSALPPPPIITTPDTCVKPGDPVIIRIYGRRQPYMDYFLTFNGVIVDTLSRYADPETNYFKPQTRYGNYDIIVQNEIGCRTYKTGIGVAEEPDTDINILGATDTTICSGGSVDIILERTQPGAKYILQYNGMLTTDSIRGTGERMLIRRVNKAGIYRVMVYVSKEYQAYLTDYKEVKVLQSPELDVSPELGYCAGGRGVQIVVKNSKAGVSYDLYQEGRWLTGLSGNGGDLIFNSSSTSVLFKKGIYRVRAKDAGVTACPVEKEVNIREVDLPAPYALSLLGGSKYMCEYPEARSILLASSQAEVEYSLYRRSKPGVLAAPVQVGTGKALTFQVQDTGTFYIAARSMIGDGCESKMANDVQIVVPAPIQVFDLSGIKNSYCDTAKVVFGSVKLSGSESNVSYELFRDGKATGQVVPGNRSILKWSGLKGKPAALATGGDNDGYIYTVNAVNQQTGCSRRMTGQVSVIEETNVLISRQDADLDVCMGTPQTLHVFASGGMLNYQWKKDGKLISSERYYAIDSITQKDIGAYQCVVSNQCGYDISANIHVNVRAVVIQDKKMQDLLICEDPADVRIPSTAIAENYKWYKLGSQTVISEKQVLELPGATGATAAGNYVCYASTTCGGIYDTCRLEFNRRPEVVWTGDVEKTLCVGSKYQMKIESRDTVKWFRNGQDLNVRGNVWSVDSLETAHAGLYTVVASNKCSTSQPIQIQTLFADEPIRVVSVTDSLKHYCKNSQVTLEIVTQPSARVTYKWYRAGSFFKDNVGNKLQFTAVLAEQGVNYLVRFTNACTDPMAPPVQRGMTIRIDEAVKYNPLGAETLICADNQKTNLVLKDKDVEGETYRWSYKAEGQTTYKALAQDTAILSLENKRLFAGYYYCDITNACETATTGITHVIVDSVPVIKGNLKDTTVCENSNLQFKLKAIGGNLTYTWKKQKKNSSQIETLNIYKPQGFETESLLELSKLGTSDDSCRIWCEVANHCSLVHSDTSVVRVVPNAKVVFEQSAVMMCDGNTARVVVKLEHGALPATYSYTFNGGQPILRDMARVSTDTLTIAAAGTYQLVSLVQGNGGCVDKNPTSALTAAYYDRYTASLTGKFEGCVGTDAEFTITIDKGQGPWEVEIVRESDGKPADEIGVFPMSLTELVSKLKFKPAKNEHYLIKRIVQKGGSGCVGLTKGTASTLVHLPDRVSFAALATDIFGGCKGVDFNTLLRPTVSGGIYYINGQEAGNTTLPSKAGKYHVVYVTRTAYGCQDSARVDLTRDVLPKVTLTCKEDLCPGESTDLQIHVDGAGTSFTVNTNMKEITLDNRELFYNNLRKRTDADGNCSYNIFNNGDLRSRTYVVDSVADKYGCGLDRTQPVAKKVITMRERPLVKVETRHALYNNGIWTSDIHDFVIPDKGTVTFRVTQLRGGNPWNMYMERTLNGTTETFSFVNNKNTVIDNIQAAEGVYRFKATDNYCSIAEELVEERKVAYTETGYLKVKVMLQGAYSEETGLMSSQIEHLLPLKGMSALPRAGAGRQWIDWVTLELRKTIDGAAVIRDSLLLRSDGFVTDRTGNELLTVIGENFSLLEQNAYYVVVKHRNHLPVASTKCRIFTEVDMATLIDLTDARYVYSKDGDLARHMKEFNRNGLKAVWGMAVGNVLDNSMISIANPNEIQRKLNTNVKGYYLHDVNFDGMVKWASDGILEMNKVVVDPADDAYIVYKNRNLFSEIPEN